MRRPITPSEMGQLDRAFYGDLLANFGPAGPPTADYFRSLTGASWDEYRAAEHDANNDMRVRPPKPYSPDVR